MERFKQPIRLKPVTRTLDTRILHSFDRNTKDLCPPTSRCGQKTPDSRIEVPPVQLHQAAHSQRIPLTGRDRQSARYTNTSNSGLRGSVTRSS